MTDSSETKLPQRQPAEEKKAKKPWTEPEITLHKSLRELTLGLHCVDSIPMCFSPPQPEPIYE